MKKLIIILAILQIFAGYSKINGQPEWQKKYNDPKVVRKMFDNPPMFYAPHAFWFWDDTIRDEKFTSKMAEEMIKQRLNPGYAHPRSSGNRENHAFPSLPYDQYLSPVWFNSFGNALKTAENAGFTLGYCDEYDWPSGQAAGRVLKQHPELEAKYLDWKRFEVKGRSTVQYDSIDFAVAGEIVDNKINASSLQLIGEGKNIKWTVPKGNWVVYTYTKKFHAGMDGGKVNYLDPKLMDVFIPIVHGQYEKIFGNKMGSSIPGVFVDNEGDYGWRMAWSDYLPVKYKEMKNRDMRLWLPLMTERDNDGLYVKARCDWFDVVSEVYLKSYFTPLVDWLKKHNMYYISNLWEESLQLQTQAAGDFMRLTREVTMPGTDCLLMKSQDVHDFKEVQSVAEFEDRPCMSEIMGVAGWNQTPAQMKMTVNSITSFGVTHVVPHGIYVNRELENNRYPADWFTENPYWNYLHLWTDFSRRAAFVNRQGKLIADVLLINPIESVWALAEDYFSNKRKISSDKRSDETNEVYSNAMIALNSNNIDFLIADKYYLDKGKISTTDKTTKISIKNHDFSAIILPPMCIISRIASQRILEYAEKGGIVIILGEVPKGSPDQGERDDLIVEQMSKLCKMPNVINLSSDKNKLSSLVSVIKEKIKPQLQFENAGRLYTAHRKIGNNNFYWLANNNDSAQNFTAYINEGIGAAEIWNCETGEIKPIAYTKEKKVNKISLQLQPYEAYWLVFNPKGKPASADIVKPINQEMNIDGKWQISIPENDTVMMTSAWKYGSFVLNPDSIKPSTKNSVYWETAIPVGASKILFDDKFKLADVWINGQHITLTGNEYTIPIGASKLSFGWKNRSSDDYMMDTPLRFICDQVVSASLESWYKFGLQQFTGYVDYEKTILIDQDSRLVKIDLGKVKYMAEIWVNGKKAGESLWGPFVFDVTKYIKKGENLLKVRIGNLMVNKIWMYDDLGKLRYWGWEGTPIVNEYDGGLYGPVKLILQK